MAIVSENRVYRRIVPVTIILTLCFGLLYSGSGSTSAIVSCNKPAAFEQCGYDTCTLAPGNVPNYFCSKVITFNPAFASPPKFVSAQWAGCQTGVCHFETFSSIPTATISFESDNGQTWVNMPAAVTELYGTTNHEAGMNVAAGVNAAIFNVLCIAGSASATAKLRPQYSTDGGNTWNEVASNTGALDADVSANNCGFSVTGVLPITLGPFGIPAGLQAQNSVQFRVVGFNGNGVGDTPIFNNISLVLGVQWSNVFFTCISGVSQTCLAGSAPTTTSMTVVVTSRDPPSFWTQGFYWIAKE